MQAGFSVQGGTVFAYYAYNLGRAVNLKSAEARIEDPMTRHTIQQKRRAKRYFEFHPHPLRVFKAINPMNVGTFVSGPEIDIIVFDFGAISITYRFELKPGSTIQDLMALHEELYENRQLAEHSFAEARSFAQVLGPALQKPEVEESPEIYTIFQIQDWERKAPLSELFEQNRTDIARLLRSEPGTLSREEVADATDQRMSYSGEDMAIIDWNGALLFDRGGEDVRSVLEFVNVELLELRLLDGELDDALEESYEVLSRWPKRRFAPGRSRSELMRIGMFQVDNALLFEGVNNALKLLSDQYLARVYRTASKRFHLTAWDDSILRKLNSLEEIYDRMTDYTSNVRIEILEWIVILLISLEIILSFALPGK